MPGVLSPPEPGDGSGDDEEVKGQGKKGNVATGFLPFAAVRPLVESCLVGASVDLQRGAERTNVSFCLLDKVADALADTRVKYEKHMDQVLSCVLGREWAFTPSEVRAVGKKLMELVAEGKPDDFQWLRPKLSRRLQGMLDQDGRGKKLRGETEVLLATELSLLVGAGDLVVPGMPMPEAVQHRRGAFLLSSNRERVEAKLRRSGIRIQTDQTTRRVMAFGGLGLMESGSFDRYATSDSVFDGLGRLCPRLRPIFDWLDEESARDEPWSREVMVICDSLPTHILEECLRVQSEGPVAVHSAASHRSRPITLFVMESSEMPDPMTASFPPDVQIKLGMREEVEGKRTRTIQVLKSRFQEIHDEPHPFVIMDHHTARNVADTTIVDIPHTIRTQGKEGLYDKSRAGVPLSQGAAVYRGREAGTPEEGASGTSLQEETGFQTRRPGITVFSSLPSVLSPGADIATHGRSVGAITFGRDTIDELTAERRLSGGGSTLLITENRCHSTTVGLHFLLGQIGKSIKENRGGLEPDLPHSLLYIALESDLIGVLHGIWRHRLLRRAVWGDTPEEQTWDYIQDAIHEELSPHRSGKHSLYKMPLRHMNQYALTPSDLWPERPASDGQARWEELASRLPALCGREPEDRAADKTRLRGFTELEAIVKAILARRSEEPQEASLWGSPEDMGKLVAGINALITSACLPLPRDEAQKELQRAIANERDTERKKLMRQLHEDGFARLQEGVSEGFLEQDRHLLNRFLVEHLLNAPPKADGRYGGPVIKPCSVRRCMRRGYRPYLYILVPELVWCGPEEVLQLVGKLLDYSGHQSHEPRPDSCRSCLRIDRVLLNRVSQVQSAWPLVADPTVLVSNLAKLCTSRSVELMIIDDTGEQSETSGHIASRWQSIGRNIIRLRRVPVHGSEVVGMELVRTNGTNVKATRPMELRVHRLSAEQAGRDGRSGGLLGEGTAPRDFALDAADAFRGYTGVFGGKPQRCRITVDLVYDRENTPLERDTRSMARNLETLMEDININVLGPDKRPGVNSALSNLAGVSHDRCHVVSIDEIWLHRMLGGKGSSGLVAFTHDDLRRILPHHMTDSIEKQGGFYQENVKRHFVTQAFTMATRKAQKEGESLCAVPFRHNWGVLAVARPERGVLLRLVKALAVEGDGGDDRGASEIDGVRGITRVIRRFLTQLSDFPVEPIRLLLWVLLPDSDVVRSGAGAMHSHETAGALPRAVHAVRELIWGTRSDGATWEDLVQFKLRVWDRAIGNVVGSEFLRLAKKTGKARTLKGAVAIRELHRWFGDDTRVDFFDFDRGTAESIVCFLLELLLAWTPVSVAFRPADPAGQFLFVNAEDGKGNRGERRKALCEGLRHALRVMHSLLSRHQRREVASGTTLRDPGTGVRDGVHLRMSGGGDVELHTSEANREDRRPPSHYALISREWLTTVPDIDPDNDIRQEMVLRHLPVGAVTSTNPLYESICYGLDNHEEPAPSSADGRRLCKACQRKGVTISGSWYLGAMSGGNRELAADIIHELVSEYHEMDRFLTRASAPVSRRFYQRPFSPPTTRVGRGREDRGAEGTAQGDLPYWEVLNCLARVQDEDGHQGRAQKPGGADRQKGIPESFLGSQLMFPFCRTRIRGYTRISLILHDLVRHAMRIDAGDGPLEEDPRLEEFVDTALRRISTINDEFDDKANGSRQ